MAKMENVKNVNRMLMRKPLGRRSHGRPRILWKKSVKLFWGAMATGCAWGLPAGGMVSFSIGQFGEESVLLLGCGVSSAKVLSLSETHSNRPQNMNIISSTTVIN